MARGSLAARAGGPLPSANRLLLQFPWGQLSCLCWDPTDHATANVLLLHGGGLDSASLSWGQTGPALAASGYRVVAPDLPGFGSSPAAPWTYTHQRLVELVGEIIAALSWEAPILGGLSMGGGLALGYGLGPGSVRGVMLLGCYGLMDRQVEGPLSPAVHLLTWGLLRTGALDALTRRYLNSRRLMASSLNGLIRNPEHRHQPPHLRAVATRPVRPHESPHELHRRVAGPARPRADHPRLPRHRRPRRASPRSRAPPPGRPPGRGRERRPLGAT